MTLRNRELLDGLAGVGFQTYLGPDGAGLLPLISARGGGLYIGQQYPSLSSLFDLTRVRNQSDTGASREIINGNIKVKSSPAIQRFTEGGVVLEDETVLEGDAVIFATG